ncbi:MAG TPA: preprotein translocase subunit SecG [Candidatus Deferrimicrobium sp.]|nr:preprotein translocase subunit SecG [Candidatus Deferrimicrobium sp.]
MFTVWVVFHVIVSVCLILVVLMQSAKGEGLAGTAFGGALSGAVFGGRGAATFLSKATTILAVLFMLNCGALAFLSASRRPSVAATTATESPITRQAQAERERMMQQQQQQQQVVPPGDTTGAIQILPGEGTQPQPTESAGK